VTSKRGESHSSSSRIFSSRDLDAICPILKIMNVLDMIGLSGLRVTRDDWGQAGYIITVYERFRSKKDDVADIGANI
jgi:hypothetical protein